MFSILIFEFKKLLRNKAVLSAIVISIILMFGLVNMTFYSGQMAVSKHNPIHGVEAIKINTEIANKHSGTINDKQILTIFEDYAKQAPNLDKKGVFNVFSHMVIYQFIENPTELLTKIHQSKEVLQFENINLKDPKSYGNVLPLNQLKLGNFVSWNTLFMALNGVFLIIVITTLFICSPVFSGDSMRGIDDILLTTQIGRTRLTLSKMLTVNLIGIVFLLTTYTVVFYLFSQSFGWSGWDTSVQCNLYWNNSLLNIMAFPTKMNLLEVCIHLCLSQFVGLLFMLSLCLFVSSRTKNTLTTFGIVVFYYFAPGFMMQIFPNGTINKFITFLNISTSQFEDTLMKLSSSNGFIFNDFYQNSYVLNGLRLFVSLILMINVYYFIKHKVVKN